MNNFPTHTASQLLNSCTDVFISCILEDGYPYTCAMEKVYVKDYRSILLLTKKDSQKALAYKQNAKAALLCCAPNSSLSLSGEMEVLDKEEYKDALLPAEYRKRLGEKSSQYCILRFSARKAVLYLEDTHETFRITLDKTPNS